MPWDLLELDVNVLYLPCQALAHLFEHLCVLKMREVPPLKPPQLYQIHNWPWPNTEIRSGFKASVHLYQPSRSLKAKPGLRLLHGNKASLQDGSDDTDCVVAGEERVDLVLLGDDVADVCRRMARGHQDVQILNKRIMHGITQIFTWQGYPLGSWSSTRRTSSKFSMKYLSRRFT